MNSDWTRYRELLEAKRIELGGGLKMREGIEIEPEPEMLDEAQRSEERELVIHAIDRSSNLLRHVTAALRRLADGSFGTCAECGEEITSKRIAAVPWAALCLSCQEQAEKRAC